MANSQDHLESSLTAPEDRDREARWRPQVGRPVLTDEETEAAMNALVNTSFTARFPRLERTYADPPVPLQMYGLFSFIPAKGATPNENGVYGFAKLRGNFNTEIEASQRAEELVRNYDSYHTIYQTYVGRPFPCTVNSNYSAEVSEIDIRKEIAQSVSASVKQKKLEEKKIVEDVQEREQELLEQSRKAMADTGEGDPDVDPYDEYITQCVKKAQLTWTFLEHLKKMKEVRESIIACKKEVSRLDESHPDFKDKYLEKYMDARRKAGMDDTNLSKSKDNFIQFMVEDIPVPTIDTDEVLPTVPGHTGSSYTKRRS